MRAATSGSSSGWRSRMPGPLTDALGALARELGVVVVAAAFERRAPGLHHNTAAVIDAERGALAGPIVELSTPGVEAGFVTLAAHGNRLVASWDERTTGPWQVVAAELTCE
mgnify:CR=1 FL=1